MGPAPPHVAVYQSLQRDCHYGPLFNVFRQDATRGPFVRFGTGKLDLGMGHGFWIFCAKFTARRSAESIGFIRDATYPRSLQEPRNLIVGFWYCRKRPETSDQHDACAFARAFIGRSQDQNDVSGLQIADTDLRKLGSFRTQ